jgi:hypothetical protein
LRISNFEFADFERGSRTGTVALRTSADTRKNRKQLPRFAQKPVALLSVSEMGFITNLQPIATFRTFLFDYGNFMDEGPPVTLPDSLLDSLLPPRFLP